MMYSYIATGVIKIVAKLCHRLQLGVLTVGRDCAKLMSDPANVQTTA